ncbi:conserved hypothetical protein [Theileria orientalis strain Shintoku]|uniref:Uncharacterized protein n=1 Tax=Theileria orientalis strain Shintoku TaxID=869250 RepID=J7M807_THEOR|nr:conserved hypothetical protein [Theileria orientalis strain Shintoku]BAM38533.1 conserved hypothetical protein [Theileria orientalis strain Shintoku]|eukprot:XP_009688834.1 conserved hypothetical protein [Theileria orientalis strain Shintoku]
MSYHTSRHWLVYAFYHPVIWAAISVPYGLPYLAIRLLYPAIWASIFYHMAIWADGHLSPLYIYQGYAMATLTTRIYTRGVCLRATLANLYTVDPATCIYTRCTTWHLPPVYIQLSVSVAPRIYNQVTWVAMTSQWPTVTYPYLSWPSTLILPRRHWYYTNRTPTTLIRYRHHVQGLYIMPTGYITHRYHSLRVPNIKITCQHHT